MSVVQLHALPSPPASPPPVVEAIAAHWHEVDPVDPMETWARMRAQSLLAGDRYRDGSTNPGVLTIEQAGDVLRWTRAIA